MKAMTRDSPMMAIMLLMANGLPTWVKPIMMKGMFMRIIRIGKGYFVTSAVSSEMPVTPPSTNELGSKKLSSPKPADMIPTPIRKKSFSR